MTRLATQDRKAAGKRPEIRRFGPIPAAAGSLALALCLTPVLAPEAAAQSRSGIVINNDVLNSLGPGPEAAPLAPLAPAAPPTPLSPRSQSSSQPSYQPAYQAAPQLVAPGSGNLPAQSSGNGSYVVTRPGTLLFPPLHDPKSTLTPGFAGTAEDTAARNDAARARALDNAFANGPEPSSQLLIPLENAESDSSVTVNLGALDALPPADPDAEHGTAPVLALQPPPQPAPPKPPVPASVLAELKQPAAEPAALAPEFQASQPAAPAMAPAAPAIAEVPATAPVVPVGQSALAAAEPAEEEATAVDETPAPSLAEAPAATAPAMPDAAAKPAADNQVPANGMPLAKAPRSVASAPANTAPVSSAPVSSAAVPAPMPRPAGQTAALPEPAAPAVPGASASVEAPVSLLPAENAAETPASPAGLQTASLTVGGSIADMTFLFEVESAELSPEAQVDLRALAEVMRSSSDGDIQVLGFASGQDAAGDQARKLALSRALKVRSFLIDAGIPSARIRVRSLGNHAEGGPANRVDIKPIGS